MILFYFLYLSFSFFTDDNTERIRPFGQPLCFGADDYIETNYNNSNNQKNAKKLNAQIKNGTAKRK